MVILPVQDPKIPSIHGNSFGQLPPPWRKIPAGSKIWRLSNWFRKLNFRIFFRQNLCFKYPVVESGDTVFQLGEENVLQSGWSQGRSGSRVETKPHLVKLFSRQGNSFRREESLELLHDWSCKNGIEESVDFCGLCCCFSLGNCDISVVIIMEGDEQGNRSACVCGGINGEKAIDYN